MVAWLGKALARQGHEVILLAPPGSKAAFAAKLVEVPLPPGNINLAPLDLTAFLAEEDLFGPGRIDVLHIHCASPVTYPLPVLKTVHGYPFHYTGRESWAERSEFGPEYSFVSRAHATACGWPDGDFVHNGLDLEEYVYSENKDDYLLFLGRVDWNVKGLGFALRLAKESRLPLRIAGTFLDPAHYENELKPEMDRINSCGGDVKYLGPVAGQEKAELISKARAFLHFALWPEPFGLTVIEALASGTPVLCTPHGAMPEIMQQGVTGFMGQSFGQTLEQLGRLKSINPKACRRRVEENFTATHMANNYLKLYLKRIRTSC